MNEWTQTKTSAEDCNGNVQAPGKEGCCAMKWERSLYNMVRSTSTCFPPRGALHKVAARRDS